MNTAAVISGTRRRWTPEEDARLEEVRRHEITRRQLAEQLGRTFKAVKRRLCP